MNVNQPCEPAAAGAPKNRRLFGLYPWLAALAVVLLWGTPARAVETSVGLINMLENNSGYTPWEWDVSDGAVFTGVYAWSCGDIIAGEALFQGGGGDLDITPGKDYTCTLKDLGASIGYPSDQICYAAGAISPPGCYDIYICDPPATNGFVRSYGYPNWVGGYMYGYTVSTNPNDPRYNSAQQSFSFYLEPGPGTTPAAAWNVHDQTGVCTLVKPKKDHYALPADG